MGLLSGWLVGGKKPFHDSAFYLSKRFHVGLLLWGCSMGDRGGFCRRGL